MMVKKKITKKVYDKTRAGKHDARGVLLNTRQHRVMMIYIYIYINLVTFSKPKVCSLYLLVRGGEVSED